MSYHQEFDAFLTKTTSLVRAARTAERRRIAALATDPWMTDEERWMTDEERAELAERATQAAQALAAEENELGALVLKLYQERDELLGYIESRAAEGWAPKLVSS